MAGRKSDFTLTKLDDLFTTQAQRDEEQLSKIRDIPLELIDDFPDHPFKVRDDEDMMQLVESVKERGVITPATVRQKEDGRYELISGHRRKRACELSGFQTLRCEVVDLSREEATILMVESNFQRSKILPSEKAFAYKMKLDAMKRQGERTDLTSGQVGQKLKSIYSVEKIAQDAGESTKQVQRYIRLNELIPQLLEMVDGNEIKFNPAYELAFLRTEEQAVLYDILQAEEVTPSLSQAQRLKRASQEGRLSEQDIAAIMREEKAQTRDTGKVTLPAKEIEQFFPKSYTPAQKKKVIVKLLASCSVQRGEQVR